MVLILTQVDAQIPEGLAMPLPNARSPLSDTLDGRAPICCARVPVAGLRDRVARLNGFARDHAD